ncbi:transporter [Pseudooceanicola nanhaiensis]|uniref:transporter n=1 Tax=Pseudooceanicola nanhaiensis TaxID=375761 RepID=UPI001CD2DA21|nr:transporter [Pseudooceanicola nanhaiensis]MCA0918832.1 transporter [Pseudooceanicola nanhaiensis]
MQTRFLTRVLPLAATSLLLSIASAQAQTAGVVSGGLSYMNESELDQDAWGADLGVDAMTRLSSGLILDYRAGIGYAESDSEGVTSLLGSLHVIYPLANGVRLGAYGDVMSFSLDDDDDVTVWSYGLSAGMDFGGGTIVDAYIGGSSVDIGGGSDFNDLIDTGLMLTYAPGTDWALYGNLAYTTSDDLDADAFTIAAAGAYQVAPDWTLFGSLSYTTVDSGGGASDVDVFGISGGAGYTFTMSNGRPLMLAGEVFYLDLDAGPGSNAKLTGISVSLTMPFGNTSGPVIPATTTAGAVKSPTHSALTSLYSTAY